jgi:hypothetical protein
MELTNLISGCVTAWPAGARDTLGDPACLFLQWTLASLNLEALYCAGSRDGSMPQEQCKLCLKTKELQDSHFMPAALYRATRNAAAANPNPTVITSRGTVQTSQQMKDFLLCKDCEELFNKNGENYVMSQVNRDGKFPLLETLRNATPTKIAAGFSWYDIVTVPNVDREKLGYFALSVFWRASVHVWRKPEPASTSIDLGPYEDALRRYLLGQTHFPANVVLFFIVCTDTASLDSFHVPSRGRKKQDTTYTFQTRGINFFMTVGKQIPESMRKNCSVTSLDKWIFSRSCEEKLIAAATRLQR